MLPSIILNGFRSQPPQRYRYSDSVVFWLEVPNFPQVKSLLLKKASMNEEINNYGDTALHYCAYLGYTEMVQWLMEHKADPNIRNKDGATPLSLAQMADQREVLALLQRSS